MRKQKDQLLLRAPINSSVGRYNSTRVDDGKKVLNSSRDPNEGTYRTWGGGRRALCVTPDLGSYWEGAREYTT